MRVIHSVYSRRVLVALQWFWCVGRSVQHGGVTCRRFREILLEYVARFTRCQCYDKVISLCRVVYEWNEYKQHSTERYDLLISLPTVTTYRRLSCTDSWLSVDSGRPRTGPLWAGTVTRAAGLWLACIADDKYGVRPTSTRDSLKDAVTVWHKRLWNHWVRSCSFSSFIL